MGAVQWHPQGEGYAKAQLGSAQAVVMLLAPLGVVRWAIAGESSVWGFVEVPADPEGEELALSIATGIVESILPAYAGGLRFA